MGQNWDSDNQRKLRVGKGNACWLELSTVAFSTTGLSVELGTTLDSQVIAMGILPAATPSPYEQFYSDATITNGSITLTRHTIPIQIGSQIDAGALSSYNWTAEPVGIVPVAGTITRLVVYNKTKAGGTPKWFVGTARCYKTGATYDHTGGTAEQLITGSAGDFSNLIAGDRVYVSGTNITPGFCAVATVAADGSTISVTGLTASGDNSDTVVTTRNTIINDTSAAASGAAADYDTAAEFAEAAFPSVRSGDIIVFGTTGAGSSNPAGTVVQLQITPTPTSALEVNAFIYGL